MSPDPRTPGSIARRCGAVARRAAGRRAQLHRQLQAEVEAAVPDFRFTDPEADRRAFELRERIIDAYLHTIATGTVGDLRSHRDLGHSMARAGLPLEHHFVAHRVAYPILLQCVVTVGGPTPPPGLHAELFRRHGLHTAAVSEAYVSGFMDARDARAVDTERALRGLIDALRGCDGPWPPHVQAHAHPFGLAETSRVVGLAVSWQELPSGITQEDLRRRLVGWLRRANIQPLVVSGSSLIGLLVLDADRQLSSIRDTMTRAARQLRDDGLVGLRIGLGTPSPASAARRALADADVALSLTAEDRPIRDLATTPVLEYIVATAGPSAAHHVTAPVATFHALADRTDPSCRTVLDAWYGNGGDHRRTAAQFHCHPNTVLNRLNRITQLTGLDPRHPAQLVDLVVQLAVLDRHRPSAG